jgi:hypothetical protein
VGVSAVGGGASPLVPVQPQAVQPQAKPQPTIAAKQAAAAKAQDPDRDGDRDKPGQIDIKG